MIEYSVRISILISLALLLAAQIFFIPIALSAVLGMMWLYLLCAALKLQIHIKKIWTLLLTFTALASIFFSYKTFVGIEAGVSVLCVFLFAKALETKTPRDAIVLFNFALFVSASSFLLSQSFAMAAMVLLCLISHFIGLYRLQTSQFQPVKNSLWLSLKQDVGHVWKFIFYALPFFILLFMFFPRLPPLWHIPIPQNKAVTGISDTMSPGDIAQLSQSSALAFRIIGDMRQLPPRAELYWRALVLDEYDGTRWTSSYGNQQLLNPNEIRRLNPLGQSHLKRSHEFEYHYLAADPQVNWIMGLEKSVNLDREYLQGKDWRITPQRQVLKNEPINLLWIGAADLRISNEQQRTWLNKRNTQVLEQRDMKTQQLSKWLYQQSGYNPEQYVRRVFRWYRQQGFAYTLTPGYLGNNRIDDFLFGTRQGFCEHYASSFVMLMRYAGIPARVVSGYQGGQLAPDGKSWEVRQLDAHAWTEVWLNDHWQRIDPTAIIAPNRVDSGMQTYMENNESVFGDEQSNWLYRKHAFFTKMRIWSDYASYQWQSKVVGYDAEAQQSWFQKIGLNSVYAAVVSLFAGMFFLVLLYFAFIFWKVKQSTPEVEREIIRFNRQLPESLKKRHSETFAVWMSRLLIKVPNEKQIYFQQLQQRYEQYAYMPNSQQKGKMNEIRVLLKTCSSVLKKL